MGTSISQPSPKNSNWQRVFACYKNKNIKEDRVLAEIWRASENQEFPLSKELKNENIYHCLKSVEGSKDFREALSKINQLVASTGGNSIAVEFAKRVIPLAFQKPDAVASWKGLVVSELTKYIISRDASGFVGDKYRNKTVNDLIAFKSKVGNLASDIASEIDVKIKTGQDWNRFVDTLSTKLKNQ